MRRPCATWLAPQLVVRRWLPPRGAVGAQQPASAAEHEESPVDRLAVDLHPNVAGPALSARQRELD
jgi:hypothetical protein